MNENIETNVKKIVSEQREMDLEKVTNASNFIDDLGADSLDIVEMIMTAEEEFGLEIPDADAEKIHTVQDAINYIQKRLNSEKKEDKVMSGITNLHTMREGETKHLDTKSPYEVLRVPGGWIYTRFEDNSIGGYSISSCFVPFNNEYATMYDYEG